MLSASDIKILTELANSETREILVEDATAFIDGVEYPATVVQRFLTMTAVREIDTDCGITRYQLTPTGRHMLSNPEVQAQLVVALGITSY